MIWLIHPSHRKFIKRLRERVGAHGYIVMTRNDFAAMNTLWITCNISSHIASKVASKVASWAVFCKDTKRARLTLALKCRLTNSKYNCCVNREIDANSPCYFQRRFSLASKDFI